MSISLVHATGNQNVRQALQALSENGILDTYVTSIALREKSIIDRFIPQSVVKELKRRSYPPDILTKTKTSLGFELGRLTAGKLKQHWLTKHETGVFCTDSIIKRIDQKAAKHLKQAETKAVYAYEDGALNVFRANPSAIRFYELPIGYWRAARRILQEESELQPEWTSTLGGLKDSPEKLARKDIELSLASLVIVPSSFVADTLVEFDECPSIKIIPYGCPFPQRKEDLLSSTKGVVRAMFVGSLTARKGLPYLLEACEMTNTTLTIAGPITTSDCPPLSTALRRHRYLGSIPRITLLDEMAQHDVFIFPTLFEGLALSLLEALSRGLVPITTTHSGAASIIRDGVNGFIVPIRSSQAIAEKIELLRADPSLLNSMKEAAIDTANHWSWNKYRQSLASTVKPFLEAV